MTVNTTTAKAQYNGNGVTTAFTVPFRFLDNTHLQVIRTSSVGVDTTLVLSTDYTVSGAGAATGTLTMLTAPASGEKLTIVRNMPFSQQIDLVNGDPLPAETLEAGLDARAMEAQQLKEALARSFVLAASSSASTVLPTPQASRLIGWDATAGALQNYDAASLGVSIATSSRISDKFNGDGVTTAFVLTTDAVTAPNIALSVGGVVQTPDINFSYTSATKTVTFLTGAPPAGTNNVAATYGLALATGSVASASITDSTATGRSVLTAASATAARTAIGAIDGTTTVNLTGNQTVSGTKTFSTQPVLPQAPTLGTSVATTSGTAIDITGIPSWVNRITVTMRNVSLSGTAGFLVQLGSGSVQTTGYTNLSNYIASSSTVSQHSSASGHLVTLLSPASLTSAVVTVVRHSGNIWMFSHVGSSGGYGLLGNSDVQLSGQIDRLRIGTTNGTDTFDSGTINIFYE